MNIVHFFVSISNGIHFEIERDNTGKLNNKEYLKFIFTEEHTKNIEMTGEEISDSFAYVESLRGDYHNMSDSDGESIDIEDLIDPDDMTLCAM